MPVEVSLGALDGFSLYRTLVEEDPFPYSDTLRAGGGTGGLRASVREKGLDHVEFREGIGESLPIDDGWTDRVISNGVLNLVADNAAAFPETYRVLSPGGRLVVARKPA